MDEATARGVLLRRKAELDEQDRLSEGERAPVQLDQDSVGRLSRIDAMQLQAMALASERRRQGERQRILAALRRMDSGEWGFCLTCGDEIATARLELDPSVTQCIPCASADKD